MFDLAGVEKREIAAGVFVPAELLLAIGVEDVGGRRQQRLHRIADAADPAEEEAQVVLLGEARELRDAVEDQPSRTAHRDPYSTETIPDPS